MLYLSLMLIAKTRVKKNVHSSKTIEDFVSFVLLLSKTMT